MYIIYKYICACVCVCFVCLCDCVYMNILLNENIYLSCTLSYNLFSSTEYAVTTKLYVNVFHFTCMPMMHDVA